MMTAKDFVALADALREHIGEDLYCPLILDKPLPQGVLYTLCKFMRAQNPRFDQKRWLRYLRGECGPRGGKVK